MGVFSKLALCHRWWRTWHTLPVFSWLKGASLYRLGRYEEAIKQYRKGLARHPNHPANTCARLDLAYCYTRTNRWKEAEEELRYTSMHSPDVREAQLRLAQFQIWKGRPLEAAWIMRRALSRLRPDPEMVAIFLAAILDNNGPSFLLKEAIKMSDNLIIDEKEDPGALYKLDVARARLLIAQGHEREGASELARLAAKPEATVEGIEAFAEILIKQGKIAYARQYLRRGIDMCPSQPHLLSLLAETYLSSGNFYSPEFAVQLATSACQHSLWTSPRELHVLAEAHFHAGDKMSALLMASKAKEEGTKRLSAYRDVKSLDRLIESLSSGTIS